VSTEAVSRDDPAGGDSTEERRLWSAWREQRDAAARERLVHLHLDFARILAAKLYARRPTDDVEFAEYFQLASVGLLEAVDRYDPTLGASFRTYASHRIQGAVLSGLEALTERARQVALKRRLEQERLQSLKEAGDAGEARGGDAFRRLAAVAVGLALGFMLEDVGLFRHEDALSGDNAYGNVELRQLLRRLQKLVSELPEREAKIIRHHYFQQVPFDEIAQQMSLTKGRVSQLHKRALQALRAGLESPTVNLTA
jgi:RNA polymerase sigma factor for flagellar operon FliA